jgi:hypothetical protein
METAQETNSMINDKKTLSASITEAVIFLYFANMAVLTVVTLACQIAGVPFQAYAITCLVISAITSAAVIINAATGIRNIFHQDKAILIGLALVGMACGAVALSYHRVGRIAVDEFYSTANPTFYVKNPSQPMSFETRPFYSGGEPFYSAAYFTAGAYEYILAVLSFFTHISYLRIYYQLAAGTAAFLLPAPIFLLLTYFSADSLTAFLGTIGVICIEIVTAESAATPGGFALIRIFEGKSIMLALGVPLFCAFTLDFLQSRRFLSWIKLFILTTALCGMTTTSFMVLPILGVILLLAYLIAYYRNSLSIKSILKTAAPYFAAYAYLLPYMAFVALKDGVGNAVALNSGYPATFEGYLSFFGSIAMPTPALAVLFTVGALTLVKGAKRTFLGLWVILAILLALNPLSGDLLIKVFRGIFYRLFYILPFPISAGILISQLAMLAGKIKQKIPKTLAFGGLVLIPMLMTLTIPSSIFRNQIYALGDWSQHEEYIMAEKIIARTPAGLMLSPYPISGAIRMLSVDYPQMITREDMVQYYLDAQGRHTDAELRLEADRFLSGASQDSSAVLQLLDLYPNIQSVVLDRAVYSKNDSGQLNAQLTARGFTNKGSTGEFIIFWK